MVSTPLRRSCFYLSTLGTLGQPETQSKTLWQALPRDLTKVQRSPLSSPATADFNLVKPDLQAKIFEGQVGGRLQQFWQNLAAIDADSWVLWVLRHGYLLPFDDAFPHLTSSPPDLCDKSSHPLLQELMSQFCLEEASVNPHAYLDRSSSRPRMLVGSLSPETRHSSASFSPRDSVFCRRFNAGLSAAHTEDLTVGSLVLGSEKLSHQSGAFRHVPASADLSPLDERLPCPCNDGQHHRSRQVTNLSRDLFGLTQSPPHPGTFQSHGRPSVQDATSSSRWIGPCLRRWQRGSGKRGADPTSTSSPRQSTRQS